MNHTEPPRDILPPTGPDVFLIQDQQVVVSADIAEVLRRDRQCRTIVVRNAEDVNGALSGVDRVKAAFLSSPLDRILALGLDQVLTELGARIVLTAGESEAAAVHSRGWAMLDRPFSTRMLLDTLDDL